MWHIQSSCLYFLSINRHYFLQVPAVILFYSFFSLLCTGFLFVNLTRSFIFLLTKLNALFSKDDSIKDGVQLQFVEVQNPVYLKVRSPPPVFLLLSMSIYPRLLHNCSDLKRQHFKRIIVGGGLLKLFETSLLLSLSSSKHLSYKKEQFTSEDNVRRYSGGRGSPWHSSISPTHQRAHYRMLWISVERLSNKNNLN